MNSTNPATEISIGIVGAGIIGTASALSLVRMGYDVTIIDPQSKDRAASYGNAGALNPSSVVPVTVPGMLSKVPQMILGSDSPLFLRWSYLPKLIPWLIPYLSHCRASEALRIGKGLAPLVRDSLNEHQELARGTVASKYLKATDYVFAYDDRAGFEADAYAWSLRTKLGVAWDVIDGDEYKRMEPALANRSYFAVRAPGHGFVSDPGCYVAALRDSFLELGGRIIEGEVIDFAFDDEEVSVILQSRERFGFAKIVVSAGAWSGTLTRKLGIPIRLESERGYHVEFTEPSLMPERPTLFSSAKFVASPMDGRLRCAGLVEFGGLKLPESKAPTDFIMKNVKEIFPELRWKNIETWMGHRPATTDSLPIIGAMPDRKNVILAFGHHHVGLASGAKTGRLVADLVAGNDSDIDLAPYRADRF